MNSGIESARIELTFGEAYDLPAAPRSDCQIRYVQDRLDPSKAGVTHTKVWAGQINSATSKNDIFRIIMLCFEVSK